MNKKINSSGKLQPYIGKGNGPRSGEYTFMDSATFTKNQLCSKLDLIKILNVKELNSIYEYTNYDIGRNLNEAIRNGTLNNEQIQLKENIISAINKYKLKDDIIVYRGIRVTRDIFKNKFFLSYINGNKIIGSTICSTSRNINRAIKGSYRNSNNEISIVFKMKIPKGFHALPVEDIAKSKNEYEVILTNPVYKITDITDAANSTYNYKIITIELEEN